MSQTTWTCPELLIKKGELLSPFRFSTKSSPHLDQGQSTQVYCVQWHLEIIFRASVHMVPSYHEVHENTQPVPWKISAVTANETVHSVFRVPESGACETQRGKKHSSSTFGKALWYRRKGTVPGQRAQKTGIWAQSHTYRLCPLDVSSASLSLSLSANGNDRCACITRAESGRQMKLNSMDNKKAEHWAREMSFFLGVRSSQSDPFRVPSILRSSTKPSSYLVF